MILLKATTETLTITTTSVADIDYSISYADITATTFAPSTNEGKIIVSTTVTALAAPAASTQRQVKFISITNRHASTTNTVILKKLISATDYNLTPTIVLLAGETIEYIDGNGWTHYLVDGSIQGSFPIVTGADTRVLFNDGGSQLGTDADLIFNKTNNHLEVGTIANNGALAIGFSTGEVTPEPNKLFLYAKDVAGRIMMKWVGPAGIDNPVQSCVGFNGIKQVAPATGTTAATCMTVFATAFTNTATTYTQVAVSSGSIKSQMRSVTMATNGTAGAVVTHRTTGYEVCGAGGYYFMSRFYVGGTIRSGQRGFHGLIGRAGTVANFDPFTSFLYAKVGLGYALSGVDGNWNIIASTTTTVMAPIDLGAEFTVNTNDVIELSLFCKPSVVTTPSPIGYRVNNLTTPAIASGILTTDIPYATVPLAVVHFVTNNATAAVATLGLNKWYLESDY